LLLLRRVRVKSKWWAVWETAPPVLAH
jgi:hypothetical protein